VLKTRLYYRQSIESRFWAIISVSVANTGNNDVSRVFRQSLKTISNCHPERCEGSGIEEFEAFVALGMTFGFG